MSSYVNQSTFSVDINVTKIYIKIGLLIYQYRVQTAASLPGAVAQFIGLRGQGPALELYPEALGNMSKAIYALQPDTPDDQLLWSRQTGSGYFYYYESTTPNKYNTGFISTKERVPETFQFMWEAG